MSEYSRLLVWLTAALLAPTAAAQTLFDSDDRMLDMGSYLQDSDYGFLPVPMVITEPATGYGGGLFGLFLHGKASRQGDRLIPPAMTAFGGGGTQNGTWFVGGGHRHTWDNDGIRYLGAMGYADINLDIYTGDVAGFGHRRAIATRTKGYGGMQKLQFRVADSPVFLGVSQVWMRMAISADNRLVDSAFQQVLGDTSTTSGVGLVAQYDTTDNFFYPRHGLSLSGEYQFYSQFLGGDYRYNLLTLEGQYFMPLGQSFTLALAGDYQSLSSQAQHLPPMARPDIKLRGISRYRYQGDNVATLQAQLEWQVTPRWIVQGFVGAGSAEDSFDALYDSAEVAWGSGFRYLIARQYGLYSGIDVAFSDSEQALYFNVGAGL